ncbi:MAG: RNA polymerase factor sigma-54 [Bacteroidales bacterium]|nr:RNA polymerase factor sigma-54 [Bacteroidales bacterium]
MLNQKFQLKLQQKLSPQQIQVIKLLEVPTMLLEQRIKAEIEENPALEFDADGNDDYNEKDNDFDSNQDSDNDSDSKDIFENDEFSLDDYFNEDEYSNYKFKADNSSPDQEYKEVPFSVGNSFQENLEYQIGLRNINEEDLLIAKYLIGNIDDDGYLRRDLESIVDDIAFAQNINTTVSKLEDVLMLIQQLDPPGIGARDLQECLYLQLLKKQNSIPIKVARMIMKDCYNEFIKKHYDKILLKLDIEETDLKDAIKEIVKLNPKPGNSSSDPLAKVQNQTIMPDFIIDEVDGELDLSLNSRNVPDLKLSRAYIEMLTDYKDKKAKSKDQKEALQFVKQKIDSAKWFIDAIKQRHQTLLGTMHHIMELQKDFFMSGDETKIKPMILKDIADTTGLDVSTISRVANSKYVQTPFGIYSLKYFFSEGLQTDSGEEVSSREIQKILQDLISDEDKRQPYTDDSLADLLKEKGYIIARRTIAKYREKLGIPVGRLRKEL